MPPIGVGRREDVVDGIGAGAERERIVGQVAAEERRRRLAVVLGFRQRVIEVEQQPVGESLLRLENQRVVMRGHRWFHDDDPVEVRVGPRAAVEREAAHRLTVEDVADRRIRRVEVDVPEERQVEAFAVEVGRRHRGAGADVPLERDVHRVHARPDQVGREVVDVRRVAAGAHRNRRQHVWIERRAGGGGCEEVGRLVDAVVGERIGDGAVAGQPVEDAVRRTQNSVVIGAEVVGQAQARRPVLLVLVESRRLGHRRVAGENHAVGDHAPGLRQFLILVAQTQIDQQPVGGAPGVLDEEVVDPLVEVHGAAQVVDVEGLCVAAVVLAGERAVLHRRAPGRSLRTVGRDVVQAGVAVDAAAVEQVDQLFLDEIDVGADLERVRAAKVGDVVQNLVALLVRVGRPRQEVRHADADAAGHRRARAERRSASALRSRGRPARAAR